MSNNISILIVGAGQIAREYIKVTQDLGYDCIVVGLGEKNINEVRQEFPDFQSFSGGLENWLEDNTVPEYAIVATPLNQLASVTVSLLKSGCTKILVEKPLTFSVTKANAISNLASEMNATVVIAFNRRSYSSVQHARRLILEDGGVSSMHFDFTEAIFRINPSHYDSESNTFWGIANSSHVIDTAFHLAGEPKIIHSKQFDNSVEWHPSGSIFTGMGETVNNVPFTYHANWGCPGKWNIEIMTPRRKLLFSPMEILRVQRYSSFQVDVFKQDNVVDTLFKPGFHKQVTAWLNQDDYLFNISDFPKFLKSLNKIFGY